MGVEMVQVNVSLLILDTLSLLSLFFYIKLHHSVVLIDKICHPHTGMFDLHLYVCPQTSLPFLRAAHVCITLQDWLISLLVIKCFDWFRNVILPFTMTEALNLSLHLLLTFRLSWKLVRKCKYIQPSPEVFKVLEQRCCKNVLLYIKY